MSIQKITQADIDTHGVKSLPSRPSAPTLYSGKALTAEELKEAFDRLPTLIAERFNALLESTGLFDGTSPADSLAELIATGIAPTHSLYTFFRDVLDGNLALYLNAGGGRSLSDVLSDLSSSIAEIERDLAVIVEGDGDLVTGAEMRGSHLTLRRDASSKSLLDAAKAYTDARVANLDNAANGVLYTYPIEMADATYLRTSENALENTALLILGAIPPEKKNHFPEPTLSTYRGTSLAIAWDEENGELVLNGTLRAADSPLRIAPLIAPVSYDDMMLMSFYRSGTVSTDEATIAVVTEDGESIVTPLLESDACEYNFLNAAAFSHIEMATTTDTVFENYRLNLLLSASEDFGIQYAPYSSRFGFSLPKRFVSQSPNLWSGGALEGETYVSLSIPPAQTDSQHRLGFHISPTLVNTRGNCLVEIRVQDEVVYSTTLPPYRYSQFYTPAVLPSAEVRIYAAQTAAASEGQSLYVDQIFVGIVRLADGGVSGEYSAPVRDEIVFPETVTRFENMFVGIDSDSFNSFNFETGSFTEMNKMLTLDGSLAIEADPSIAGRFSAPLDTPADLFTKKLYLPSALFQATADESCAERVWFTEGRVHFQSSLFVHMDAEGVKQFLNLCPVEVVYGLKTLVRHGLTAEEMAFGKPLIVRTAPLSYLYCLTENGDAIKCRTKIQYQLKKT